MEIVWNEIKNEWLQVNRAISFEEISGLLLEGRYLDIVENPTRENQYYFIIEINNYTWVVPFLIDETDCIVLKTAFPSRKFHKKYGGKNDKSYK